MKYLPALVLTLVLLALLAVPVVSAQDSPLPTPEPTLTPVPDLPPGLDPDDPDIVGWLAGISNGAIVGAVVAWLLEKTRLKQYMDLLDPEARRNVVMILCGTLGALACALLSLLMQLPEGAIEVINALLAMVFSQVAHGRLALGKS